MATSPSSARAPPRAAPGIWCLAQGARSGPYPGTSSFWVEERYESEDARRDVPRLATGPRRQAPREAATHALNLCSVGTAMPGSAQAGTRSRSSGVSSIVSTTSEATSHSRLTSSRPASALRRLNKLGSQRHGDLRFPKMRFMALAPLLRRRLRLKRLVGSIPRSRHAGPHRGPDTMTLCHGCVLVRFQASD